MTQVVIHQWLLQGLDKNYGNLWKKTITKLFVTMEKATMVTMEK